MSKETFSENISEVMYKKIKALNSYDLKTFFEKDDNFLVAFCIAYMSLSKEKIIDKDIKNGDRLGRLKNKVDISEVDKVFKSGFSKEMPIIISAKENNNLWILDNIRDSIMHGACEIDEDRKCFILNNSQHDRELSAIIPFSWFIAYAKNDILSKKVANKYTVYGFYYNKDKKGIKSFDTQKEIMNNILYRVNISGDSFNIKDIENRINELFLFYAGESDNRIINYKGCIKYNEKYLSSFCFVKEKVKNEIEKEFPGVKLNIFIDNKKSCLIKKKFPKHFYDYDLMFNMFNSSLTKKGMNLLKYMTNIIENIDNCEVNTDWKKITIILHKLLTNEVVNDNKTGNLSILLDDDLKVLKSIYLSVYGLSTLVINHEILYTNYFLNSDPSDFGMHACLKSKYIDFASKQKCLIMNILDIQIVLFDKYKQLNSCRDLNAKSKIQTSINDLELNLNKFQSELDNLYNTMKFDKIIKSNEFDFKKKERFDFLLKQYYEHFENANSSDSKKKIKKAIGNLLDIQMEESKYIYGYCYDMKEVLNIIRNCFSHIGRVSVSDGNLYLNDYDSNGEKSGEVICKYDNLINLLRNPLVNQKVKSYM